MSYETDLLEELSRHKNWTRFDASRLIGAAALFTLVLAAFAMGGDIWLAFNFPSFVICAGRDDFVIDGGFRCGTSEPCAGIDGAGAAADLRTSDVIGPADVRVFRGMIASLYASGVIGFFIGLIQLLSQLERHGRVVAGVGGLFFVSAVFGSGCRRLLRPMYFHLVDKLGNRSGRGYGRRP